MVPKLQRPILVGGLGLTASAWLLQWGHPTGAHLGETIVWGALAAGGGLWWLQQRTRTPLDLSPATAVIDRATVEQSLAAIAPLLTHLETELPAPTDVSPVLSLIPNLRDRLAALTAELDRTDLHLMLLGGQGVGKTALAQHLSTAWKASLSQPLTLNDTAGLFSDLNPVAATPVATTGADLVVFVTAGDLTDSEFQVIKHLQGRKQRVVVAFNKQDQYLPADRPLILQQVRERLLGVVPVQDVVAIAAAPAMVKVRQHQADGTTVETVEQPAADVAALTERLTGVVVESAQSLIFSTILRQTDELKQAVLAELNRIRRDRALPLIEQAQWIAAAAAFATPVASLDLLATAAINTQLVLDLGAIYQQRFSMEQAKAVSGKMAELMVKLGLVELSSQAIAPLLKSHAVTFVAGGLVQGVSAAYLTRVAGLSLVEYFQEQSQFEPGPSVVAVQSDRLIRALKAVFQDNQRTAFLQTLVQQAIPRLMPKAAATALPTAAQS